MGINKTLSLLETLSRRRVTDNINLCVATVMMLAVSLAQCTLNDASLRSRRGNGFCSSICCMRTLSKN